jgi:hypothetical protein
MHVSKSFPKVRNFVFRAIFFMLINVATTHASAGQVTLAWNPNTESDLAGYRLHYGTASGSYTVHLDVHNVTTYTVGGLTDGQTYYFAATAYDASGNESGYSNQVSYSVNASLNQPPVIKTGPQVAASPVVLPAATVVSVTASDPNGDPLTYAWSRTAGPGPVSFTNSAAASTAVAFSTSGSYTLQVVVSDGKATVSGSVNVSVQAGPTSNQAPKANAGADQTVNAGSAVTLLGAGTDPENAIATYRWRQTAGTLVTLTNASAAQASFTAPAVGSGMVTLAFELQVTDAAGLSATDSVSILVQSADIDGDGVPNSQDAFPANSAEWKDSDGDGTGDNADPDDDNDGIPDTAEDGDRRHLIGVFRPGTGEWQMDLNANRKWDGSSTDGLYKFGQPGDLPVIGDWNKDGVAEIGVFRPDTGRWFLDLNGNDRLDDRRTDGHYRFGTKGDLPVTGAWNKKGVSKIGVFRPETGEWFLDLNNNRRWDGSNIDGVYKFGRPGDLPVTGDWNSDGVADIGVFRPSTGEWLLDLNGNRKWDGGTVDGIYKFGRNGDLPVTGDWNGDGVTEIGVFRPSTGEWLLDLNGNDKWDGGTVDGIYKFGINGDLPVTGSWL